MDLEQRIALLSPAKLALLEDKLKRARPEAAPGTRSAVAGRLKSAPLSFAQERLWFLEQLEPESGLYNLPAMFPLRGPVDPGPVEATVRQIVERHGALRTRFIVKDDSPYQVVGSDAGEAFDFSVIDLRAPDPRAGVPGLAQVLDHELWRPFDLATGPLVRVRLILQRDHDNLLLVVMHHIVSDGWSIHVFGKEFRALYESAHTGRPAGLAEPLQYADYATQQRQQLQGDRLQALLAYWRAQLEGAPSVIALPLDRPRPPRQSFKGALHR
ncbi:MAG TPA: condensation domain-containing protein, partial [Kofleriaceae bacterium]